MTPTLACEDLWKKRCRSLRRSMVYGMADLSRDLLGLAVDGSRLRRDEFWAVREAAFEVQPGECLGVIGANGSGKTTLLKMLTGVIAPDRGRVRVRGRISSLIEVGAGLHPLLSGRENIYVSGAILGLGNRAITERLDAIVEFADLGAFIDTPVKHYSSGMQVRLGFSVAAHMGARLLVIDEALAVGDHAFAYKCYNHIGQLLKEGVAAVFVSHQLNQVQTICQRAIWLDRGATGFSGAPLECINAYLGGHAELGEPPRGGERPDIIRAYRLRSGERQLQAHLPDAQAACPGGSLTFEAELDTGGDRIEDVLFELRIWRGEQLLQTFCSDADDGWNPLLAGRRHLRLLVPALWLAPGRYQVAFGLMSRRRDRYLDWYPRHIEFSVAGLPAHEGVLALPAEWDCETR